MKILIILHLLFLINFSYAKEFESIRIEHSVPALSAQAIRGGKILYTEATGVRKLGSDAKVTIKDKHHLGSCSKSMTATLVAKLVDLKLLKWNSKLSELLPNANIHKDLKNVDFELLLVHRSGLVENLEYFSSDWIKIHLRDEKYSAKQGREFLARGVLSQAPKYKSKTEYKYSNMGYIMAAHILEQLTKSSYEDLMQKYIFNPLKMNSCGFGPVSSPAIKSPLQPWGHKVVKDVLVPLHADNPKVYNPAGAIHCSLDDWGKYLNMHIAGFNKKSKFLTKESFEKLYTKYPIEGNHYTYGGWNRVTRVWAKGDVLSHRGSNTMNFSNVWVAPYIDSAFMSTTNAQRNGFKATDAAIGFMINKLKTP